MTDWNKFNWISWHIPLKPALQSQADLCETEASLFYTISSRTPGSSESREFGLKNQKTYV